MRSDATTEYAARCSSSVGHKWRHVRIRDGGLAARRSPSDCGFHSARLGCAAIALSQPADPTASSYPRPAGRHRRDRPHPHRCRGLDGWCMALWRQRSRHRASGGCLVGGGRRPSGEPWRALAGLVPGGRLTALSRQAPRSEGRERASRPCAFDRPCWSCRSNPLSPSLPPSRNRQHSSDQNGATLNRASQPRAQNAQSFTNSVSISRNTFTRPPANPQAKGCQCTDRRWGHADLGFDGRRTEVTCGSCWGLYSVQARDFIVSTTAAGFKCRMYRSVVATEE